eukprot:7246185-Pyramimonas_sp.AAC.2
MDTALNTLKRYGTSARSYATCAWKAMRRAKREVEIAELEARLAQLRAEEAAEEREEREELEQKVYDSTTCAVGEACGCECDCHAIAAAGRGAVKAKLREGVDFSSVFCEENFDEDDMDDDMRKTIMAFDRILRCVQCGGFV